jgi:hypothetical protein
MASEILMGDLTDGGVVQGQSSGASSQLFLSENNVGIGTTNPCSTLDVENGKLVVQTTSSSYGLVQILNPSNAEASMAFAAGVTGGQGGTIQCPSGNLWIIGAGSYGNAATVFGIANANVGYILAANSSGYVGIGTTAPTATLDVNPGTISNSNPNLRLQGTTSTIPSGGKAGDVQIYSSGSTNRMYVNFNGTWHYATLT